MPGCARFSRYQHLWTTTFQLALHPLQNIAAMIMGAVAVPLIIGDALNLPVSQRILLINADLFCCGIITILQSWRPLRAGIGLPVMMGCSFMSVTPALAIAQDPSLGLQHVFGAFIAGGCFAFLIAPLIIRILRFFPRSVISASVIVLGISVFKVSIGWSLGHNSPLRDEQVASSFDTYRSGGIALVTSFVTIFTILILRRLPTWVANLAIIGGIVAGTLLSLYCGYRFSGSAASGFGATETPWFAWIQPFAFGWPRFDLGASLAACLMMLVLMIESLGVFITIGAQLNVPLTHKDLVRGLRTDGLGTIFGGMFNSFAYTSYAQNVALVAMNGQRSPVTCVIAGSMLILASLIPALGTFAVCLPMPVVGGAACVIFGQLIWIGLKMAYQAILESGQHAIRQGLILCSAIGAALLLTYIPALTQPTPEVLHDILRNGIVMATFLTILLNSLFLGPPPSSPGAHRSI